MFQISVNTAVRRAGSEGVVNLSKRRCWFTDEQSGAGLSSAGTQNTEQHMIPKSRFDEVLTQAREAQAALKKFQEDSAAAEAERLKKQGEWQQIAENEKKRADALEPLKTRAEALEKMIREGNEARVQKVSEDQRSLIPVDYPPERLSAWLDSNWDRLTTRPAPNIDAGAGGAGAPPAKLTDDEKQVAAKAGMTEAEYIAAKQKAGMTA